MAAIGNTVRTQRLPATRTKAVTSIQLRFPASYPAGPNSFVTIKNSGTENLTLLPAAVTRSTASTT